MGVLGIKKMETDMFKIEKDVPIIHNPKDPSRKYPFPHMEVGDSFFVEGQKAAGPAANAAHAYARIHGIKFKAASIDGGVRIWRIA